MRVTLIHNPRSGSNEHDGEALVDLLREFGHHVSYHSTGGAWHASLNDKADCVAVAGGDGTVADVARSLAGRGVPIAVLPLGTANNIGAALGVTGAPLRQLIAGWTEAVHQPFDLGTARGPWGHAHFLESVGAGVLSDAMADIDEGESEHVNELDDPDARVAAALDVFERLLRTARPVRYDLTLDGREESGDYLLVEVLNFGAAGPNLQFTPFANGTDGLLDVAVIHQGDRQAVLDHLTSGSADRSRPLALPTYQARRVAVTCDARQFHVDDEVHRAHPGERFSVEASLSPAAVTFLVPRAL